jgi:hypothetical protein
MTAQAPEPALKLTAGRFSRAAKTPSNTPMAQAAAAMIRSSWVMLARSS